ncbi:hypothetical protein [Fusobacterium sp. IOR10]|uniref:hypothetical protein n=1 Tax=Fusobacterium sp. IOR10 TaxID=2665157 RepID=UPI0013D2B691|nr:hypothetical protein [Fusobacterium sp. IOR10]
MKKIIIIFSFVFLFIGCSNLENNRNNEECYRGTSLSMGRDLSFSYDLSHREREFVEYVKTKVVFEINYCKNADKTWAYMKPLEGERSLRKILFSNGEKTLELKITNFSIIDALKSDEKLPQLPMTKVEVRKLYSIFKGNKPITMRVYTTKGWFDANFNDKYRYNLISVMDISLGTKN